MAGKGARWLGAMRKEMGEWHGEQEGLMFCRRA